MIVLFGAACMVACGDADGAVTGNTRRFGASRKNKTSCGGQER